MVISLLVLNKKQNKILNVVLKYKGIQLTKSIDNAYEYNYYYSHDKVHLIS